MLTYYQNRLSFDTYQTTYDHSEYHKFLYLAFSQNNHLLYTTFGYSTNEFS